MGKIVITIDPLEEFNELFNKADKYVQERSGGKILKYLKSCEPAVYDGLVKIRINHIQSQWAKDQDIEYTKKRLREWCVAWNNIHKIITKKRTKADLINIHKLQTNFKINKYNYRNILMQETGKQSAANMLKYEIELAMHGMRLFDQGKLDVSAWDKTDKKNLATNKTDKINGGKNGKWKV